VLARQRVEAELAALYRKRAIQRARAAERDTMVPLQAGKKLGHASPSLG